MSRSAETIASGFLIQVRWFEERAVCGATERVRTLNWGRLQSTHSKRRFCLAPRKPWFQTTSPPVANALRKRHEFEERTLPESRSMSIRFWFLRNRLLRSALRP